MNNFAIPKIKIYSLLISMPLISIAFNLLLYKGRLWSDVRIWYFSIPFLIFTGTIISISKIIYNRFIESKYPELSQTLPRVYWKIGTVFIIVPLSVWATFSLYESFKILSYESVRFDIPKGIFIGITINLIFETFFESEYIQTKMKETSVEREMLEIMSLQSEFDTLKNQINPHFLFNCFNTLSSLITLDREKAEQFLDELSKVYRYLLRNNEDEVNTVENELKFITSYFQLLKTRHGEAVQLNFEVDKKYYNYLLPSLTLQLLVENAVKHNVLSKTQPLIIDIFTTAGNKLVVNNNLQRRTAKVPSNKIGLENIKIKYQLLKQTGYQIIENEKNFTVVLPLIWKS
jgi:two-component system, LytTR family, sensor kinase